MVKDIQFVTNAVGEKTAVIVPIETYEALEEMMEDRHLARVARESKDEERISWSQVKTELVAEGKLDDA